MIRKKSYKVYEDEIEKQNRQKRQKTQKDERLAAFQKNIYKI